MKMINKFPAVAVVAMIALAAFVAFPTTAASQTMKVNIVDDVVDFGGLQQVGNLPGPDGKVSFREACIAANNTSGPQTIAFAIPESEYWLMAGIALLRLEGEVFSLNDDGTIVDFTTQAAFNGGKVGIYGLDPNGLGAQAISINGNNCVIKGLDTVRQRGYAARIMGNNNRVISCNTTGPLHTAFYVAGFVGFPTPTGNVIGGTQPGEGNVLSSVGVDGPAEGTVVIGNRIRAGISVQGAVQYGAIVNNTRIGGTTAAERNVISGAGGYGEEGFPVGDQVSIVDADNTLVAGNYIGTTADGMAAFVPQIGPTGVEIRDSRGTTIRNNLIAGLWVEGINHFAGQIFGQAVHVSAANKNTRNTVIQGNTIGLAADGITPIRTRSGIMVTPLSTFYHAFNTLVASNHIGNVETNGVFVSPFENGVKITTNSIHDSGGLGIELSASGIADGPALNDPRDVDTGANGLQNFPVIAFASQASATSTLVGGSFNSTPNQSFILEFFSNPACDPIGFGEGQEFLGSTVVTTNGSGNANFSVTLPAGAQLGDSVTGTATDANGNTSEFSQCRTVSSGGPAPTPTPTPTATVQVTIQTNPTGRTFTVDGNSYTAVQSFSWQPSSSHTIATTSPQNGGTGTRYVWSSWSDGGAISHTVAPTTNKTYTATFTKQYYLTMANGTGGTVTPASGWRNSGTAISISATPTNNTLVSYSFSGWTGSGTGSYSGTNNPASITMNGPITETAAFTQNPVQVTVQTNPARRAFTVDGNSYTAAQSFSWQPGSSHTIATTSPQSGGTGVRYVWTRWSDSGAISHTVAPTTNTTYTATFRTQYYLTMTHGTGGTVTPTSGWRNSGATISINATPASGYSFSSWTGSGSGSYSGTNNPASITIRGPITERATFTHY